MPEHFDFTCIRVQASSVCRCKGDYLSATQRRKGERGAHLCPCIRRGLLTLHRKIGAPCHNAHVSLCPANASWRRRRGLSAVCLKTNSREIACCCGTQGARKAGRCRSGAIRGRCRGVAGYSRQYRGGRCRAGVYPLRCRRRGLLVLRTVYSL